MTATCLKCGSDRLIPDVGVIDQGQYSDGNLKAFLGHTKPDAWILKGPIFAPLRATICGACGFVELLVDNPELRYEQYLELSARNGGKDPRPE